MTEKSLSIREYMKQDAVVQSFKDVVGDNNAIAYINSVLIAAANNQAIMECSPESIFTSAMRAATLRLSCDPGIGQAYLVPFKGKCTLIIGYKGIKDMAIRTGKYRYLNVSPIFEGEEITEDRLTGMHSLSGGKTSNVITGYLLYFELISGYRKSFYMGVDEIAAHAMRYSKSINREDSPWKTNLPEMQRKTVLRLGLTRWGYFDPNDAAALVQIDEQPPEDLVIDTKMSDPEPQPEKPVMSEQQIIADLGY